MTAVLDLFDRLSLTRKLTAIGVVTSAVSLVAAGSILMAYDVSNSRQDLMRDTGALAESIARDTTATIAFDDGNAAAEVLKSVARYENIESVIVFDADGRPFARYDRGVGASRLAASRPGGTTGHADPGRDRNGGDPGKRGVGTILRQRAGGHAADGARQRAHTVSSGYGRQPPKYAIVRCASGSPLRWSCAGRSSSR